MPLDPKRRLIYVLRQKEEKEREKNNKLFDTITNMDFIRSKGGKQILKISIPENKELENYLNIRLNRYLKLLKSKGMVKKIQDEKFINKVIEHIIEEYKLLKEMKLNWIIKLGRGPFYIEKIKSEVRKKLPEELENLEGTIINMLIKDKHLSVEDAIFFVEERINSVKKELPEELKEDWTHKIINIALNNKHESIETIIKNITKRIEEVDTLLSREPKEIKKLRSTIIQLSISQRNKKIQDIINFVKKRREELLKNLPEELKRWKGIIFNLSLKRKKEKISNVINYANSRIKEVEEKIPEELIDWKGIIIKIAINNTTPLEDIFKFLQKRKKEVKEKIPEELKYIEGTIISLAIKNNKDVDEIFDYTIKRIKEVKEKIPEELKYMEGTIINIALNSRKKKINNILEMIRRRKKEVKKHIPQNLINFENTIIKIAIKKPEEKIENIIDFVEKRIKEVNDNLPKGMSISKTPIILIAISSNKDVKELIQKARKIHIKLHNENIYSKTLFYILMWRKNAIKNIDDLASYYDKNHPSKYFLVFLLISNFDEKKAYDKYNKAINNFFNYLRLKKSFKIQTKNTKKEEAEKSQSQYTLEKEEKLKITSGFKEIEKFCEKEGIDLDEILLDIEKGNINSKATQKLIEKIKENKELLQKLSIILHK